MQDFKYNFKNMYQENDLQCRLGCSHIDTQENILKCDVINEKAQPNLVVYNNIFSNKTNLVKEAANALIKAMDIRSNILNPNPN